MKKYNVMLVMLTLVLMSGCAKGPSEQIKQSFETKYADANDVHWKGDDGIWEASYRSKGRDCIAVFVSDGTWVENKQQLDYDEIPRMVWDGFVSEYQKDDLMGANEVDRANGKFYEFKVKSQDEHFIALYDKDGHFKGKEDVK